MKPKFAQECSSIEILSHMGGADWAVPGLLPIGPMVKEKVVVEPYVNSKTLILLLFFC